MRQFLIYLVMAVFVLALGGCRFGPVKDRVDGTAEQEPVETPEQMPQAEGAQGFAGDLGTGARMEALNDPDSPLSKRVLYFDFDSSKVTQEQREIIDAHAAFLSRNPDIDVVLEGHADERGTREYNLALGERRANAVQRFLIVNGASRGQIETVSYGEEKPAVMGSSESAWAQNRRVELVFN